MTPKKTLALALVALMTIAAAAKPPAKPPASPRSTPPAATHASMDVRDPASLIGVLAELRAKAEVARRDSDAVFLTVTSATETFSAQFAGCDGKGVNCQAVLFDRQGTAQPTQAQLNAFNQTSVLCRVYQDKAGRPHVEYSALLFPNEGRAELLMHVNAWRGCLGDFEAFLKDPPGYLAGAA
jgi:hypothetical protein